MLSLDSKTQIYHLPKGNQEAPSMLYQAGNEREKEDFSCPAKFLLPSEHVLVINISNLRLHHQAVKYFLIWGSEFGTLVIGDWGKESESNEYSLKELH